jgi:hypothetical protein
MQRNMKTWVWVVFILAEALAPEYSKDSPPHGHNQWP